MTDSTTYPANCSFQILHSSNYKSKHELIRHKSPTLGVDGWGGLPSEVSGVHAIVEDVDPRDLAEAEVPQGNDETIPERRERDQQKFQDTDWLTLLPKATSIHLN